MADETTMIDEEKPERKKKGPLGFILSVIIIGIIIVFVALLITSIVVDDFNNIGELFEYIGYQFS